MVPMMFLVSSAKALTSHDSSSSSSSVGFHIIQLVSDDDDDDDDEAAVLMGLGFGCWGNWFLWRCWDWEDCEIWFIGTRPISAPMVLSLTFKIDR